ncbi:uncharacterized protein LOC117175287 [Belonocnema kinseyi]|uniref:uncharacterized protein LOC117175287 n=1 Tax=Belonocnema kinseyi TaxID=2817044 RepID=UPI00143CEF02|nr:uncharacterized protein LOC117175287 [Belonocnema kinseyi]
MHQQLHAIRRRSKMTSHFQGGGRGKSVCDDLSQIIFADDSTESGKAPYNIRHIETSNKILLAIDKLEKPFWNAVNAMKPKGKDTDEIKSYIANCMSQPEILKEHFKIYGTTADKCDKCYDEFDKSKNIKVADKCCDKALDEYVKAEKPAEIDLLIGAEFFYQLLCSGQIRVKGQSAVFQEARLGWILAGRLSSDLFSKSFQSTCNLIKFQELPILWELGNESISNIRSKEELACEEYYKNTIRREVSSRYCVKLPFNDKRDSLGNSRNTALPRFHALERRFEKDPALKEQYTACIQGYFKELHIKSISSNEPNNQGYYLPHHAVVKTCSLTTKTRVVFDGSAKTTTGISLNDSLMVGPTIQEDLFSIITRFRTFQYALTADIEQMYRQVVISEEDTRYQKILWRKSRDELIETYCLNTRDFYVDDLLTGASTYQETVQIRNELIEILKKGGFHIRKWASNDSQLMNFFSDDHSKAFMSLDPSETIKTLGIHWDAVADSITYTVNVADTSKPISKRSMLSQISKLFDPLGLLGPVMVIAKIIIQQLLKLQLTWDTLIPEESQEFWNRYQNQLQLLNNIEFSRCVLIPNAIEIQLHGFCDASEKAYGACFYFRSNDPQGNHQSSLICSKSRVAPLKTTTIPRLELCAANLLSSSPSHTLKTFVANRVAEIQAATQAQDWFHVPTQDNSADLLSRGPFPEEFLRNTLCTHGPRWLSQGRDTWPQLSFKKHKVPKTRINSSTLSCKLIQEKRPANKLLKRFSNYKRLETMVAYCLRFINNCKNKDPTTRQTSDLSTRIIKVGGRLANANVLDSHKHPIVLPKHHHISKIIIRDEHIDRMHAGVNATLYGVRETFWPIDGRNTVRDVVRQCIRCFRAKPSVYERSRPFTDVGVDYCGPFFIKERLHRNRIKIKTYVSIFVCLATKAVHLELACDLSTEAFLASLKKFLARRGLPNSISSDNATNFVSADRQLRELYHQIDSFEKNKETQAFLLRKEINWRFNLPRAPYFGSLWEAAVKSFKNHFTRIAGNTLLTYEQLQTYVAEIEAILNSRPLSPLSSDPNDLLPLTPGHFLIGTSLTSFPQRDKRNNPANRLNCWELAQQMRHHFWDRWHREYLGELISRSKWKTATKQEDIEIGTLIVIKEENLPPMNWKIGRINEVHPGQDGVIRAVTV